MSSNEIRLSLHIQKESFVRAESIKLRVCLENRTSSPSKVEDLTYSNDPLSFYAKNDSGKRFSGSLKSSGTRERLRSSPNFMEKTYIVLQPGERIPMDVDLLTVTGELPEGKYELKAAYASGLFVVRSEKAHFKILKSNPIYSKTAQDYLRTDISTIRTAWINKEENGLYLFIMENSQYHPPSLVSNRRILKIEEPEKVHPSLLSSPDVETEHLIWFSKHSAKVASVHQERFKGVADIKLQFDDVQSLEPSISTEDSRLNFMVASKENDNTVFRLVSLPLSGDAKSKEVCRFSGDFAQYSVVYDEDLRLHMVWVSKSGEIWYVWQDLEESTNWKGKPELLVKGEDNIADVQLSRACKDELGNLQLLLNFVSYASPTKLHSQLMEIETRRELSHSFHELPELHDLTLLETILDLECNPHFLLRDREGELWFKSFAGATPVKVTEKDESHPNNIDYPKLLVSSNESRHYGIYLRYIKNKERFVYRKLKSLE